MLRRLSIRRSLPPLIALFWAASAAAQGSGGTVSGLVTDSLSRAPIPGAEVLIGDATAANARTTRTTAEGRYVFTGVPAGARSVSVRMVGFAPKAQRITVRDGETTTADFAIEIGRAHV